MSGFIFQHDRNIITYRISKPVQFANQLLAFPVIFQRPLADWASEYVEQFLIQQLLLQFDCLEQPVLELIIEIKFHGNAPPVRLRE